MRCSFCEKEISPGTGWMYVLRTGKSMFFCSRKCRVNMLELKRSPQKVKWVKRQEKA